MTRHTRKLAAEVARPRDIEQRQEHREAEPSSVGDNDNDNVVQLPPRTVCNQKRRENRRPRVITGNQTSGNASWEHLKLVETSSSSEFRNTENSAIEELVRSEGYDIRGLEYPAMKKSLNLFV